MPQLQHFWQDLFQLPNRTVHYENLNEENEHYWGFSVRPFQRNISVEVLRQWTVSDANLRLITHFEVRTQSTGGLIRFSKVVVIGP